MSRLAEVAPWMVYAALVGGIVLMVVGVLWRGAAPVEWGFIFGFAKNSTVGGKAVYLVGGLAVLFAVNAFVIGGLKRRRAAGCPPRTQAATVVGWQDSGILQVKVGSKSIHCFFAPTWDDEDAVDRARKVFPPGQRLCAAGGFKAADRYQVVEGERVKTCLLYHSRARSLDSAYNEAKKAAEAKEGAGEADDHIGDDSE